MAICDCQFPLRLTGTETKGINRSLYSVYIDIILYYTEPPFYQEIRGCVLFLTKQREEYTRKNTHVCRLKLIIAGFFQGRSYC